jgi:heat shock protein HtpX
MWEAIQANARRSRLLIGLMGAMLVLMGFLIGYAVVGPEGGIPGALVALAVWFLMLMAALAGGEQLVLMTAKAREIQKADYPRLWNVVEEMTIASGLGKMPKVYIMDNDLPNAFATGRRPDVSAIAVTSGLLKRLNRDELQGVVAHEIAHVKNMDVRFMTIAAVMLGSIVLMADLFLRMLWFGGGRRRDSGGGGQAQALVLAIAVVMAILAPIFARLLYFACSRKREYLADASAARFTRYPEGLASALEKITGDLVTSLKKTKKKDVQRALAPMYIVNPLQAASKAAGLFSTHPPAARRIEILRAMGGNAGWVDYERAFREVTGGKSSGLDSRTLESENSIAARAPTAAPDAKKSAAERGRDVADLIDRMVSFLIIGCPCGVRIKVPPGFKRKSVNCTRCGREHEMPEAKGQETAPNSPDTGQALRYTRRGEGWESFKCSCGKVQQIGPALEVASITCRGCGRKIEITAAG